jgi:hypothetical protein
VLPPYSGSVPHRGHAPAGRATGRPSPLVVTFSYLWALVPLITLGLGTWVIIGWAAIRLGTLKHALAAAGHFVAFIILIIAIDALGSEPAILLWIFGVWVGGTVHAFLLRRAVFSRRHPVSAGPTGPTFPPRAHSPWPRQPWNPGGATSAFAPRPTALGRLGPYMLLNKIGEGAQGAVYRAQGPDGRQVAVKVLHDRLGGGAPQRDSFILEAMAARQVPPFSTARVLDVGVMDGTAYIVSEYVPGRSLESVVRDRGPVGPDTLTRLAIQTSAALSGIHSANIVHRDFKPSNILIADDGPRVIDFGVAKALEQVTMTGGGPKGTPAYMSPEQISGRPVGPKSDVFSWASTMFYGATGRLAFGGSNYFHTANLIMNHRLDLSAIPRTLQGPMSQCLDKDPRNRPTAAELMVALAR